MNLAISFLPLIIIIVEWRLRKRIVHEDADRMTETKGKRPYIAGAIILSVIALIVYFSLDIINQIHFRKWYWLITISVGFAYNIILSWIYIRESNEHIVSIISGIISIVYLLLFVF